MSQIEAKNGENEDVLSKKILLASEQEENEKLFKLIDQAYAKYPQNLEFVSYKYDLLSDVRNLPNQALKVLTKYNKSNNSINVKESILNHYFSNSMVDDGLKILNELIKEKPAKIAYKATLSRVHFALGNYNFANSAIEEVLNDAPYLGYYHKLRADSYYELFEQGRNQSTNKNEAVKSYKNAILYNPLDYEARERLRKMQDKKEAFDYFPEYEAEEIFKTAPKADDYPEDNSIILLNEVQRIIYEGGASESVSYLMVKVFNSAGVDNWKEYGAGGEILEAKVYKENGDKLDAETNYGSIVFTDLEPGDCLYVKYKRKYYYRGKLAEHFWGRFYFSHNIPSLKSTYRLLVPNSKEFTHLVANSDMKPQIDDKIDNTGGENLKLYTWEKVNIQPFRTEPYMPYAVDFGEVLHYSSFKNWQEISDWYTDLSATKARQDFEVEEAVNEIFEGKENLSDKEKAELIYQYIVQNIRYSSISFRQSGLVPQRASKVINTKLGDCKDVSTLYVAMCKEVGLDANLVLINTRDNGDKELMLPSIDFNHCIAKVNIENEPYYVELTSDKNPFSSFGRYLKNASSLDIVPQNSSLVSLNPTSAVKNKVIRNSTVTFDGDNVKIVKDNLKIGVYGANMRYRYKDLGDKKRRKRMQEAIGSEFVDTKLEDLEFDESITNNEDTVRYKYSYTASNVFTDVGGLYIFKVPYSDMWSTPKFITSQNRKFDVNLWEYDYTDLDIETVTLEIPKGKTLANKPKDVVISNKYFDYSLTHKLLAGKLTITRKAKFNTDIVPVEEFETFKSEFQKALKADGRQIGFK